MAAGTKSLCAQPRGAPPLPPSTKPTPFPELGGATSTKFPHFGAFPTHTHRHFARSLPLWDPGARSLISNTIQQHFPAGAGQALPLAACCSACPAAWGRGQEQFWAR